MFIINMIINFLLKSQKSKYGKILESSKIWSQSPYLFLGISTLYGAIDRKSSPITPLLRALVNVYISQLNGCRFCIDINSHFVLSRGGNLQLIKDLPSFEKSDSFSEREKAILNLAYHSTLNNPAEILQAKKRLLHTIKDDELIEIAAMIAFQNMSTKFNNIMEVEPQGFCHFE